MESPGNTMAVGKFVGADTSPVLGVVGGTSHLWSRAREAWRTRELRPILQEPEMLSKTKGRRPGFMAPEQGGEAAAAQGPTAAGTGSTSTTKKHTHFDAAALALQEEGSSSGAAVGPVGSSLSRSSPGGQRLSRSGLGNGLLKS